MGNTNTFPLLKLAYLPLANVIQQFDSIHERVHLATLSKQTAILVKSLEDIKVVGLELTVSKYLNLTVIYLVHGRIRNHGWIYESNPNTPDFPFLVDYSHLKNLIDTMFFVFTLSGFEELVVSQGDGTVEVPRLQNLLRNLNTIKFLTIDYTDFCNQVLATFPFVKNVSWAGMLNNQVLTKKLEILELNPLSFDGLDLVNCESLQLTFLELMGNELNEYLEVWIQGRMPRLKHIHIQFMSLSRQDSIFEGIENEEADRNRELTFKSYSLNLGDPQSTVVRGGLDIESEDGARATITTQNGEQRYTSWNMNVWE